MRTLSVKRKHKDGASTSLRLGKPIDGAKPFEVYGFAGSIGSLVAFALYIFWAYLPESWLHVLGITYYPSRYWAVAIPSYLMVTVMFILALYTGLNIICTPPPQSLYTLCDDHTRPSQNIVLSNHSDGEECPTIPPYSDIPIIEINSLLLGPGFEQGLQRGYSRDVSEFCMMETIEEDESEETVSPYVYLALTKKTYEISPVVQIQRRWRLYLDKLRFKHVRNTIHGYEQEDSKTILLRINRSEAALVDKAAGLHVRFRLSGPCFPPIIVYKVYTHRPVVDMCSFSPRNYSQGRENLAKAYVRCENNLWRPVIGAPAEQTGPKVVLGVPRTGGYFSNSREERRILKVLAVKKRKLAWLRKLYVEGRAAECDKPPDVNYRVVEPAGIPEPELPDLELMRWSASLDFDAYERDWYSRATSLSELYDEDWHKLGTCRPGYDLPACTMPVVNTPVCSMRLCLQVLE